MGEAELEQRMINLATGSIVVLGAVCGALAKAGAIDPEAFMNHLEAVRREWLERRFGMPMETDGMMTELMTYLEIQADFAPHTLPDVWDNPSRKPPG